MVQQYLGESCGGGGGAFELNTSDGAIYAGITTADFILGGTSTASAKLQVNATTGNVTQYNNGPYYLGSADASGYTNGGTGGQQANNAVISGKYAYVVYNGDSSTCSNITGSATGCELKIFDISNPSAPEYITGVDSSAIKGSGSGNANFNDISIVGNYAYIVQGGDATECSASAGSAIGCELKIFDISDPTNPTYVGGADSSGTYKFRNGS